MPVVWVRCSGRQRVWQADRPCRNTISARRLLPEIINITAPPYSSPLCPISLHYRTSRRGLTMGNRRFHIMAPVAVSDPTPPSRRRHQDGGSIPASIAFCTAFDVFVLWPTLHANRTVYPRPDHQYHRLLQRLQHLAVIYACSTLSLFFECTRFTAPRQGLLVQHF